MQAPVKARVPASGIALMVLLCAVWGIQQVTIKAAIAGGMPPLLQVTLRGVGSSVLVALWMAWREGPQALHTLIRPGPLRRGGALIALCFGVEFLMLYPGIRLTTASRGVLFLYTTPFFTALGAHLFLPDGRLRARQLLGLVIAFLGVAAAFTDGLTGSGGSLLGDGLCTLAAMLWGVTNIVVKTNKALRSASAAAILLYQIAGSVPLLAAAAWLAGDFTALGDVSALAWGALFYQTVLVSAISYQLWFWMLQIYPATQLSGLTFLTPLFGILAGGLLLGDPLGWPLFAGLAAIAAGMRLLR